MNGFPRREIVEKIKEEYPSGTRIVLLSMRDVQAPPIGTKGTVEFVDDIGTIHPTWDTGDSLGIVYGEDSCRKTDPVKVTCYNKEEEWEDRMDAVAFYKECMAGCDPSSSEYSRYRTINEQLQRGLKEATDETV